MRNLVLLVVFALGNCLAQTGASKPADPESIGVVYLLDSSDQSIKALPDEALKVVHSSIFKAAYGSKHLATISFEVAGERSPLRISTDKAEFVFTFDTPENVALYLSSDAKNKRLFPVETVNTSSNTFAPLAGIQVAVAQFGKSSYKLVPKSPLAPGEYLVILRGSQQAKENRIFTFGVDR